MTKQSQPSNLTDYLKLKLQAPIFRSLEARQKVGDKLKSMNSHNQIGLVEIIDQGLGDASVTLSGELIFTTFKNLLAKIRTCFSAQGFTVDAFKDNSKLALKIADLAKDMTNREDDAYKNLVTVMTKVATYIELVATMPPNVQRGCIEGFDIGDDYGEINCQGGSYSRLDMMEKELTNNLLVGANTIVIGNHIYNPSLVDVSPNNQAHIPLFAEHHLGIVNHKNRKDDLQYTTPTKEMRIEVLWKAFCNYHQYLGEAFKTKLIGNFESLGFVEIDGKPQNIFSQGVLSELMKRTDSHQLLSEVKSKFFDQFAVNLNELMIYGADEDQERYEWNFDEIVKTLQTKINKESQRKEPVDITVDLENIFSDQEDHSQQIIELFQSNNPDQIFLALEAIYLAAQPFKADQHYILMVKVLYQQCQPKPKNYQQFAELSKNFLEEIKNKISPEQHFKIDDLVSRLGDDKTYSHFALVVYQDQDNQDLLTQLMQQIKDGHNINPFLLKGSAEFAEYFIGSFLDTPSSRRTFLTEKSFGSNHTNLDRLLSGCQDQKTLKTIFESCKDDIQELLNIANINGETFLNRVISNQNPRVIEYLFDELGAANIMRAPRFNLKSLLISAANNNAALEIILLRVFNQDDLRNKKFCEDLKSTFHQVVQNQNLSAVKSILDFCGGNNIFKKALITSVSTINPESALSIILNYQNLDWLNTLFSSCDAQLKNDLVKVMVRDMKSKLLMLAQHPDARLIKTILAACDNSLRQKTLKMNVGYTSIMHAILLAQGVDIFKDVLQTLDENLARETLLCQNSRGESILSKAASGYVERSADGRAVLLPMPNETITKILNIYPDLKRQMLVARHSKGAINFDNTVIFCAIRFGQTQALQEIIEGFESIDPQLKLEVINSKNIEGRSALDFAFQLMREGYNDGFGVAKILCQNGADITQTSFKGAFLKTEKTIIRRLMRCMESNQMAIEQKKDGLEYFLNLIKDKFPSSQISQVLVQKELRDLLESLEKNPANQDLANIVREFIPEYQKLLPPPKPDIHRSKVSALESSSAMKRR